MRQFAAQSPQYFNTLPGGVAQLAKDSYLELGQGSYGRFEEVFQMPADADPDGISASYVDGVLRIEIPRRSVGVGGPGRFVGGGRALPGSARYRQDPRGTGGPQGRLFGGID